MIRLVLVSFITLLLLGCGQSQEERAFSLQENIRSEAAARELGEIRRQIFKECMELAAEIPQDFNASVESIVAECSASSRYMMNSYKD